MPAIAARRSHPQAGAPGRRARVEEEIRSRINLSLWNHARSVEKVEVESMQEFHKSWQASICFGRKA
jgi:hypothetical protein